MKKFLQTAFVAAMTFFAANSYGQLANGSILPAGINLTDLNGNTYDIDALISGGKTIFIDVSATWCGPCWGFHQTHILDDLFTQYGPSPKPQNPFQMSNYNKFSLNKSPVNKLL